MIVNDNELNLIISSLRVSAMAYEDRAKEATMRFNVREAMAAGAFAQACKMLSERLDKDRPRRALNG